MQSGRRFFITGWRSSDAVTAFAERLARAANGTLEPIERPGERAWLFVPQDDGDVTLARGLCAEYDVAVCLRLDGVSRGAQAGGRACLVIDPIRLQALKRYGEGAHAVWGAQAGCTLGALADAGLTQFADLPTAVTLAQWAAGAHPAVLPGQTALTGVMGADVLFADGTVETVGGFGTRDTRPLRSQRVQAAVPALFELTRGDDARLLRARPRWPAIARLDALMPPAGQDDDINVARVFLGNRGRHGWVLQWLLRPSDTVLRASPDVTAECDRADAPDEARTHDVSADAIEAGRRLDDAIARVLDPENLYSGATAAP